MVAFKERILAPAGMHIGILYQFIDLGTQEMAIPGQQVKYMPKIKWSFELPLKLMPNSDRPFSVSQDYTASLSDKANLVLDIKAWTGERIDRNYNFKKLLGKAALLNIVHNDKGTYEKIAAISPLMEGQSAPKSYNPLVYFDLTQFDQNIFKALPNFIQEMIAKSPEYKGLEDLKGREAYEANMPTHDDIPFSA